MSIYHEMVADAYTQLADTYNTPAYAAAKENYFKVFEICAAKGLLGIIENDRLTPETHITEEVVADLKRSVEILKRTNYPYTNGWENDYRLAKAQLSSVPA